MKMMLFGPPGVGKGTQTNLLSEKYKFTKFSTGDFLRKQILLNTPLGDKVKSYLERGNLVPDEIIIEVVKNFLIDHQNEHIIFDGFPRTLNQALIFEKSLVEFDMLLELAVEMCLDDDEIVKRLTNRYHCPHCGRIYNRTGNLSKKDGICDSCGQELIIRIDDTEEIIKKRLEVYKKETKPLANHYKSLSIYHQIDATGSQETVLNRISAVINGYIAKK